MIKSYASLVGLRLVSFGLAGAFLGLVTLVVPAAEFGRYSLVLSVLLVIGSGFLSFGNPALLRFGREEYTRDGALGRILTVRLAVHAVLLLTVLAALWVVYPFLSDAIGLPPGAFGLLALGLLIVPMNEMATHAAQSVERYTGYGLAPVVLRLVQLLSVVAIYVWAPAAWEILLIGTLVGYAACAAISWSRVPRLALRNFKPAAEDFRRFTAFSWSMPLATMSVLIVDWMDLWFIQHFLGVVSVGIYAWVYNLSLLARAITTPLGALMGPRLIDLRVENDTAALVRIVLISQSSLLLAVALAPGIVGLFSLGAQFLSLGSYGAGIAPAMILIAGAAFQLGVTFWYPMILAQEALVARGTLVLLGAAGINALGNWLLIPQMGLSGAAISTAIAIGSSMTALLFIIRRHHSIDAGPSAAQVAAFGAGMIAVVAIATSLSPPAGAALCLLASAASVFAGRHMAVFSGLSALSVATAREDGGRIRAVTTRTLSWLSTS